LEELDKAAIYRLHAQFCKTLSNANRLLMIAELAKGEVSVNELAQRLQLRQANVSKHLGLMRERGLVVARRDGAIVYYALSDPRIIGAIKLLKEVQADQIEKQHSLAQGSP
jgi:DNA-binding transcriptional ArsR family regulator